MDGSISYINNVSGGIKIAYDNSKPNKTDACRALEKLFDEKLVAQIIIITSSNTYILHKKDDSDELGVYDVNGKLLTGKTVQDVLEELNNDAIFAPLLNTTNLTLEKKIIQIANNTATDDITQDNINSNHSTACKAKITNCLTAIKDAATPEEVEQLEKELTALLAIAPQDLTVADIAIGSFEKTDADTNVKTYTDRLITAKKEELKALNDKKQAFITAIPTLKTEDLTTVASNVPSDDVKVTMGKQSWTMTEICGYLENPDIMAKVLIQLLQKNPEKFNESDVADSLNKLEVRTALSANLSPNQRIISFKEKVEEKERTCYMLVERQSDGNYKIIVDQGYQGYQVEMDDGEIKVKTKDNGTVEADVVVDGYWRHFQRTGMSIELYRQIWEDSRITREEFKEHLNGTDVAYNFASMGGVVSAEGDGEITGDDFVALLAHVNEAQRAFNISDADVFKAYFTTKKFVYIFTDKPAKKIMGKDKEIKASALLGHVGTENQEAARRIICNLLGIEYGSDITFGDDKVLDRAGVACFLFGMGFLAQLPDSTFEDTGAFKDYKVNKPETPGVLRDAEKFMAWLKGEAVAESTSSSKGSKSDKPKDYTGDYTGKSAEDLIKAKRDLKTQLRDAQLKLRESAIKLEKFIKKDPTTGKPIGKSDGMLELTTTTPDLETDNKTLKESREKLQELEARIFTIEELLKTASTNDPIMQAQIDIDKEDYDKVINNTSLPDYIKAYAYLQKANKLLKDEALKLSLEGNYSKQLETANENQAATIEKEIHKAALEKTKQDRESLLAEAKKLISSYFEDSGSLKDGVGAKEKAMILYIYSQYIIQEAGADQKKLNKANVAYITLLRTAGKSLKDMNQLYPLYETISDAVERINLLYSDIIDGQLEFQHELDKGIPSKVYETLDIYINSLKTEITALEKKSTLTTDEADKLRGYYERLFSLYQAKAEYDNCLELGRKIIKAMETDKIEKTSIEDDDNPNKSRKGLSDWKGITKAIEKDKKNRKRILEVKLEDLMATFYNVKHGETETEKKSAKQQAIYKTLELLTLIKQAEALSSLNKKAAKLSKEMNKSDETKNWPDPKDRFKTFADAQNYLDDLYQKAVKE